MRRKRERRRKRKKKGEEEEEEEEDKEEEEGGGGGKGEGGKGEGGKGEGERGEEEDEKEEEEEEEGEVHKIKGSTREGSATKSQKTGGTQSNCGSCELLFDRSYVDEMHSCVGFCFKSREDLGLWLEWLLVECLHTMHKAINSIPSTTQSKMVSLTCSLSLWEMEQEKQESKALFYGRLSWCT